MIKFSYLKMKGFDFQKQLKNWNKKEWYYQATMIHMIKQKKVQKIRLKSVKWLRIL